MGSDTNSGVEARIRACSEGGRLDEAIALGVEAYGPEILGFLLAILRDEQRAREVYSDWTEDVCRGMPSFAFRASWRTWAYTLARHAWHRSLARGGARMVPLSDAPEVERREARARTPTSPHLRTDMKQRVAELRQKLDPEDQALLVLRVDRGLAWLEIADVMLGPDPDRAVTRRARETEAAALRKRFERIKDHLRELAREAQILPEGGFDDA